MSPIASTSKREPTATNSGPVSPSQRLQDQCEILDRLAEGEGISMQEWDGVVGKCFVCDKIMLEAVLEAHGRDCWHAHASASELDADKWGQY